MEEALRLLLEIKAKLVGLGEVKKLREALKHLDETLRTLGAKEASVQLRSLAYQLGILDEEAAKSKKAFKDLDVALTKVRVSVDGLYRAKLLLKGALQAVSVASAAYLSIAGKAVTETVNWSRKVYELSQSVGLSAEEASKLTYATERMGLATRAMRRPFSIFLGHINQVQKDLSRAIPLYDQQNKLIGYTNQHLARYGIAVTDASGKARNMMEILAEVADVYVSLSSNTEKAAFAKELFGWYMSNVTPLLDRGGDALRRYSQEAENMHLVLSTEALVSTIEFQRSLEDLKLAVRGVVMEFGSRLIPRLHEGVIAFRNLVMKAWEMPEPLKSIASGALKAATSWMGLVTTFGLAASGTSALAKALGSAASRLGIFGTATAGIIGKLGVFIAFLGKAVLAITLLAGAIKLIERVTGTAIVPWDKLNAKIREFLGLTGMAGRPARPVMPSLTAAKAATEAAQASRRLIQRQIRELRRQLREARRAYEAERRAWEDRVLEARERVALAKEEVAKRKAAIDALKEAIDKEVEERLRLLGIILDPSRLEDLKDAVADARDQLKDAQDALEDARARRRRYGLVLLSWEEINAQAAVDMAEKEKRRAERELRLEQRKWRIRDRIQREVERAHAGEMQALEAQLEVAQKRLELEQKLSSELQRAYSVWRAERERVLEQQEQAIQDQIDALQDQLDAMQETAEGLEEVSGIFASFDEQWAEYQKALREWNIKQEALFLDEMEDMEETTTLAEHIWAGIKTRTLPAITTFFKKVREETKDIYRHLKEETWPSIRESFSTQVASIRETWNWLRDKVWPVIKEDWWEHKTDMEWYKERWGEVVSYVSDKVYNFIEPLWSPIEADWDSLFSDLLDYEGGLSGVLVHVTGLKFSELWGRIKTAWADLKSWVDWFADELEKTIDAVKKVIKAILSPVLSWLGRAPSPEPAQPARVQPPAPLPRVPTPPIRPALPTAPPGPPPRCFVAGTPVATEEGPQPIETIEVGQLVYTPQGLCKVIARQEVVREDLVELEIAGEVIRCSKEHRFYVEGVGWVEAQKLRLGDILRGLGAPVVLTSPPQTLEGQFRVFNLQVERAHCYYVGRAQVLVHNIKLMQEGGFVAATGPYILHRGELVLNARQWGPLMEILRSAVSPGPLAVRPTVNVNVQVRGIAQPVEVGVTAPEIGLSKWSTHW